MPPVHGNFFRTRVTVVHLLKIDGFVKSLKPLFCVIPAEAGIQENQGLLDPGLRRGDGSGDFYECINIVNHVVNFQ